MQAVGLARAAESVQFAGLVPSQALPSAGAPKALRTRGQTPEVRAQAPMQAPELQTAGAHPDAEWKTALASPAPRRLPALTQALASEWAVEQPARCHAHRHASSAAGREQHLPRQRPSCAAQRHLR